MRRHGNLFQQIVADTNIFHAYQRARRGKTHFFQIRRFEEHKEENLALISRILLDNSYVPSEYRVKTLFEPKKRTVYILPFMPDRIIHHAMMQVLIPIWEPMFIRDSYACIDARGQHAGSRRVMEFISRNAYCLKCDISKFYPSVDHDILLAIIKNKIKCKDTLRLLEKIIRSFPGGKNVPIGNYTSQWFGNLYMNELDQYVKHTLRFRDYLRYCDDFCFFHNDKTILNRIAANVQEFCGERLALRLSKCDLFHVTQGVDFLGYRHFRNKILLRKSTALRMKRKVKKARRKFENGKYPPEKFRSFLASVRGWIRWANTHNLSKSLQLDELWEVVNDECAKI